jgi:hypothetical protein
VPQRANFKEMVAPRMDLSPPPPTANGLHKISKYLQWKKRIVTNELNDKKIENEIK